MAIPGTAGRPWTDRSRTGKAPASTCFADLLASTRRSVIRLEMRGSCDPIVKGFAGWQATGDTGAYEWGDHLDVVRAAVARGVMIRRVRWYRSRRRITGGGGMPAPTSTSAPARTSAGCRAPKRPACCWSARTAGCPATGWCGGTSSAAMHHRGMGHPIGCAPTWSARFPGRRQRAWRLYRRDWAVADRIVPRRRRTADTRYRRGR